MSYLGLLLVVFVPDTLYYGHMITGDECGPDFLTFVLRMRENPGKTSTRKLTRPGIETVLAVLEVTILPLDYSGGLALGRDRVASPTLWRLYPWGKPRYSFYSRLSGLQDQSGFEGVKKNLHPSDTRDRTRAVQPIAKRLAALATYVALRPLKI